MKVLEAISIGKRFGRPEANEDNLVVMPHAGYSVIDGVTDRNGTRYGGMLAGQFASRAAGRAISRFLSDISDGSDHQALVEALTNAVAQGYRDSGRYELARADQTIRAGCAAVVALIRGDQLEVVSVGDSGVRLNGTKLIQGLKPLDDVTSRLRRETWRLFEERGMSSEECDRLASSVTWKGTRNQPPELATSDPDMREQIERQALAVNRDALPDVPEAELLELIHNGIIYGQGKFQNAEDLKLGYGVIDGFAVPSRYIETFSMPLAEVETIELFSDGYFSPGKGFGVAAWEKEFERVEHEDPHKIGRYMSTKGSTREALTDDRTYLGVRLR
jgi:hypothetical protein